jgi:excisionase family DNA binding protein
MCAVLRCSRRSGYRLADSGRIHALRATDAGSSRLLIPRDALARYLRTLAGAP